ncbi:hypothetical protein LTR93_001103 [Exophiala xenobiotica]|nr:hypothetical protein LTR93_001103 [Exophiala xenobiotica]
MPSDGDWASKLKRGQHLTQADLRVFGQSYPANCSSVDGQAAFLGEASDHSQIEYFQSADKYMEPGLPHELPARVEEELIHDPGLCGLQERVAVLERQGATGSTVRDVRRLISNYRRRLSSKAAQKDPP